jgi:hypothetical protein
MASTQNLRGEESQNTVQFICCADIHTHERLGEALNTLYNAECPRYVDLVSDFAGQEFFILDGEALLQNIFRDPLLDLGRKRGGSFIVVAFAKPTRFSDPPLHLPRGTVFTQSGATSLFLCRYLFRK